MGIQQFRLRRLGDDGGKFLEAFANFSTAYFTPLDMMTPSRMKREKSHASCLWSFPQRNRWRETDSNSTSAVLGDGGVYFIARGFGEVGRALRNHTLFSETEIEPALTPVHPPKATPPCGWTPAPTASAGF